MLHTDVSCTTLLISLSCSHLHRLHCHHVLGTADIMFVLSVFTFSITSEHGIVLLPAPETVWRSDGTTISLKRGTSLFGEIFKVLKLLREKRASNFPYNPRSLTNAPSRLFSCFPHSYFHTSTSHTSRIFSASTSPSEHGPSPVFSVRSRESSAATQWGTISTAVALPPTFGEASFS